MGWWSPWEEGRWEREENMHIAPRERTVCVYSASFACRVWIASQRKLCCGHRLQPMMATVMRWEIQVPLRFTDEEVWWVGGCSGFRNSSQASSPGQTPSSPSPDLGFWVPGCLTPAGPHREPVIPPEEIHFILPPKLGFSSQS